MVYNQQKAKDTEEHLEPIGLLERTILDKQLDIESWFRNEWLTIKPPLTCSVDLRNSGFKLAAIDTNLFPAGFNNISDKFIPLCIQAMQHTIQERAPSCKSILIIPESHSRNTYYLESLASLSDIIIKSGYKVRIGSTDKTLLEDKVINLPSGKQLLIQPLQQYGNKIGVEGFVPCFLLLNNDLSEGVPSKLQGFVQSIEPPRELGWTTRSKSIHFNYYSEICHRFGELISIDPWFINPLSATCHNLDLQSNESIEELSETVDTLLSSIQKKYNQYDIKETPFVVVKADSGTYGMGVIMIHDSQTIKNLNRKQRNKLQVTKGNIPIKRVMVQEGVYAFERLGSNKGVAEPVIYLLGSHVVGGFYRVHNKKGAAENLNSPGMHFETLPFTKSCINPDLSSFNDDVSNRLYVYGVIARLALLAAAKEVHAAEQSAD